MRELLGLFYIVRFIICGVALGVLFIKVNIFTFYSKNCIFGIGFCSTPFFLSFIEYICCIFVPGIPAQILVFGVPV